MDDPWAPNQEFLDQLDLYFEGADCMNERLRRKRLAALAESKGESYRVLITGSKDWNDRDTVMRALLEHDDAPHVTLVSGACPTGTDAIAEEIAANLGWSIERHPANKEMFGAQADYIRNNGMVKLGADVCLAFRRSASLGTGTCADLANGAGIKVVLHEARTVVMVNQEMFRVACTAIVFNKAGKMLITRRAYSKKQWPGKWTVPGGGFQTDDFTETEPTYQEGESTQWYGVIERGVRREVREETGLEISTPWLVTDLAFIRNDNVPVIVLSYAANLMGPDRVRYDEDTIAHAWVDLEEAKEYDLIDGIIEELRMAHRVWVARDDVEKEVAKFKAPDYDMYNE